MADENMEVDPVSGGECKLSQTCFIMTSFNVASKQQCLLAAVFHEHF